MWRERRESTGVVGEVVEEAGDVVHGVEGGGVQERVERGEWGL